MLTKILASETRIIRQVDNSENKPEVIIGSVLRNILQDSRLVVQL